MLDRAVAVDFLVWRLCRAAKISVSPDLKLLALDATICE